MTAVFQKLLFFALLGGTVGAPVSHAQREQTTVALHAITVGGASLKGPPMTAARPQEAASAARSAERAQNTLFPLPPIHGAPHANGTTSAISGTQPLPTGTPTAFAASPLQLSLINNLNSSKANAYVSALDRDGKVVMLTPDGSFYYLQDSGSETPQVISANIAIPLSSDTVRIAIPDYIEGARIWFADGELKFSAVSSPNGPALVEPTAINPDDASSKVNWGFIELTYIASYGLFANLSFVDFLGLPLAMELQASGSQQLVKGTSASSVQEVCDRLKKFTGRDAKSWADLCVLEENRALRVISPSALLSQKPHAFPSFFAGSVDRVWNKYASSPLIIDTQSPAGHVECKVTGGMLTCEGDNRGYAKPTAGDIFGCNSGPFAIHESDNSVHKAVVPRLCAAFNRGTLLVRGGETQPNLAPTAYYKGRPHNWYSAFVHRSQLDGRGYAFAYDDVAPNVEEDVAGAVAAPDPRLLTVYVGGLAQ